MAYIPDPAELTYYDDAPPGGYPSRQAASAVLGDFQATIERLSLPTILYDNQVSPLPPYSAIPARFYAYPTPNVNSDIGQLRFADYWVRVINGK